MAYQSALTALADPTRRALLERLRDGPQAVSQIAAGMPVSRPAVSQHLKALKAAGLVTDEARGTARIYRIHADGLRELREWLDTFWEDALARFKDYAEAETDERR
ncbi:MAG: winged helix-turn-helix transcriptional regulator [Hyphomonadaceae bacterium]|nr:winged helix-turn-helix transcriptional regulator [Hyphomonadaceae bacterium]MBX3510914.1 winged helix-turn-helix transcriptional regulator [Hyphomonadaceae bacterium]